MTTLSPPSISSINSQDLPKFAFPSISPPKTGNNFLNLYNTFVNSIQFAVDDYATGIASLILPTVSKENAIAICHKACEVFKDGPSMLKLSSPLYIVGDIHGHILDLFRILKTFGYPKIPDEFSQEETYPSLAQNAEDPKPSFPFDEIEIEPNSSQETSTPLAKSRSYYPSMQKSAPKLDPPKSLSISRSPRNFNHPSSPKFPRFNSVKFGPLQEGPIIPEDSPVHPEEAQLHEPIVVKPTLDETPHARYLLLGDLVDRGEFSVETILFTLLMKIIFQDDFFIIRGNHEFEFLCTQCGFSTQLASEYGPDMLPHFLEVFSYMPLATLIDKNILCVHGGLGPSCFSVGQIASIERPIHDFSNDFLNDLLWSDPSKDTDTFSPSNRGTGHLFGESALKEFVYQNNLKLFVRAHECVMEGFEYNFDQSCLTVFSASNYCGLMNNKAAVLHVIDSDTVKEYKFPPLAYLKRDTVLFKFAQKARRVSTVHFPTAKRTLMNNSLEGERLPQIQSPQHTKQLSEFPSFAAASPPKRLHNDFIKKQQTLPNFKLNRRFSSF